MRSTGGKSLSFIVGILIGVLAALGIVFLMFIEFNPFAPASSLRKGESRDTLIVIERIAEIGKQKQSKIPKQSPLKVVQSDSLTVNDNLESKSDTLNTILKEEEIIVKRDELVAKKTLELIVKSDLPVSKSDSLIQQLENIPVKPTTVTVEFWRSPVNFRGYKFVRSTIVVFGLDPMHESKIYRIQNLVYLKHNNIVYLFRNTEVFAPLRIIQDESILNQLR